MALLARDATGFYCGSQQVVATAFADSDSRCRRYQHSSDRASVELSNLTPRSVLPLLMSKGLKPLWLRDLMNPLYWRRLGFSRGRL